MDLLQWFDKGLTAEEYISGMKVNKNEMTKIYNQFTLNHEEKEQIQKIKGKWLESNCFNRRLVWGCDVKHTYSSQHCRGSEHRCSICFARSKS